MILIFLISTIFTLLAISYLYLSWSHSYWKRIGLNYIEPHMFFGNFKEVILQKVSLGEKYSKLYREFKQKGVKHGGLFLLHQPIYMPLDLDIIKNILIKDFKHFMNHGLYVNEDIDPLTAHLFSLENERWRQLKSKLTPAFTPGKIKNMFPTMLNCTSTLTELLTRHETENKVINVKQVIKEYAVEVIGCVAFSIDYNVLKDPNSKFKYFAKMFLEDNTFGTLLKCLIGLTIPKNILSKFGYKQTRQDIEDFFMGLLRKTIQSRDEASIDGTDFLKCLLQLKNEITYKKNTSEADINDFLTFNEIAAQCFLFFIAGFEPPTIALTFALLELSLNPEIQKKLREEINSVLHGMENELTYRNVMEMEYLDKVIQETIRKHPPGAGTIRVCNEKYSVPNTNIVLESGTRVFIPIQGIHNDPDYYPDPEIFDPERFNAVNVSNRHPCAFLTFGEGPRKCLGSHLGILQVKLGLISIIKDFQITLNPKTKLPIKYTSKSFSTWVEGGVWLDVSKVK